jgi:hypothetical protein
MGKISGAQTIARGEDGATKGAQAGREGLAVDHRVNCRDGSGCRVGSGGRDVGGGREGSGCREGSNSRPLLIRSSNLSKIETEPGGNSPSEDRQCSNKATAIEGVIAQTEDDPTSRRGDQDFHGSSMTEKI